MDDEPRCGNCDNCETFAELVLPVGVFRTNSHALARSLYEWRNSSYRDVHWCNRSVGVREKGCRSGMVGGRS